MRVCVHVSTYGCVSVYVCGCVCMRAPLHVFFFFMMVMYWCVCVCMRAPFNFFYDGYAFVCVGGGGNSMFIVLTGVLVLISMLL